MHTHTHIHMHMHLHMHMHMHMHMPHAHAHAHAHDMHMPQVMIGDSWSDIVAAQRAGCVGVLVVTGQLSVA